MNDVLRRNYGVYFLNDPPKTDRDHHTPPASTPQETP